MSFQTEQMLKVIRAERGDEWYASVREELDSGRNFFLILPDAPEAVEHFCKAFELKSDCLNQRFTRSDLMLMSQHIDSAAFDEMLAAWDSGHRVIFLEQIDFPMNRPPHVKPFLIYSSLWGIISQHDDERGARRGLEDAEPWGDRSLLAHPAIYRFQNDKWKML